MATDSGTQTEVSEVKQLPWVAIGSRIAISAVSHPFEYVKVLIQLGHEPLPPYSTRTLFGRPALALPGAFKYIKHIKATDGFLGLYRGLAPKMCAHLVSSYVYSDCLKRVPSFFQCKKKSVKGKEEEGEENSKDEEDEDEEELTDEQRVVKFLDKTLKDTLARCAAVIASQPFHVITIRTMAQFVGREENYNGIFSSITHIFKEDGIRGYFAGLAPRIVGEVLTLWFAHTATFIVNTYFVEEKVLQSYAGTLFLYVASALTYPFTLVTNVMAVNNCGLAAGMPPNMPVYINWADASSHLSSINQLKRGSSILWRYYSGPLIIDQRGRAGYPQKTSFKAYK